MGAVPVAGLSSVRLSSALGGRDNNLNLLRMIAAMAVLVTHGFALVHGSRAAEPLLNTLGMTLGDIAVDVFFAASGLLVTGSLVNGPGLVRFVCARALRVYPGLVVMLLILVGAVGSWMTVLPSGRYFTDPATLWYLLRNALLFFNVSHQLPGVFLENPWPRAVNGSLWTLPSEVWAYGLLAVGWRVTGRCRDTASRRRLIWMAVAAVVSLGLAAQFDHAGLLRLTSFTRLFFMFSTGAAMCLLAERVVLSRSIALVLLLVLGGLAGLGHSQLFGALYLVSVAYIALCVAYLPGGWIRQYNRVGDYSFGVYIYAWPVQQTVIALWPGIGPWSTIAASLAMTLVLAAASWHGVEKPALSSLSELQQYVARWVDLLRTSIGRI